MVCPARSCKYECQFSDTQKTPDAHPQNVSRTSTFGIILATRWLVTEILLIRRDDVPIHTVQTPMHKRHPSTPDKSSPDNAYNRINCTSYPRRRYPPRFSRSHAMPIRIRIVPYRQQNRAWTDKSVNRHSLRIDQTLVSFCTAFGIFSKEPLACSSSYSGHDLPTDPLEAAHFQLFLLLSIRLSFASHLLPLDAYWCRNPDAPDTTASLTGQSSPLPSADFLSSLPSLRSMLSPPIPKLMSS